MQTVVQQPTDVMLPGMTCITFLSETRFAWFHVIQRPLVAAKNVGLIVFAYRASANLRPFPSSEDWDHNRYLQQYHSAA